MGLSFTKVATLIGNCRNNVEVAVAALEIRVYTNKKRQRKINERDVNMIKEYLDNTKNKNTGEDTPA